MRNLKNFLVKFILIINLIIGGFYVFENKEIKATSINATVTIFFNYQQFTFLAYGKK